MKVLGIIAEYNPFHLGHQYQLNEAKKRSGADAVVVAMSGNYTQRGAFAYMHKGARAEAALKCGADLVIELPFSFSMAPAERFAQGGIALLSQFCDILSCGCETASTQRLEQTVSLLLRTNIQEDISKLQQTGVSYAVARERVVSRYSQEAGNLLSNPNDTLAVEYQKAILSSHSAMEILPIQRVGTTHHADSPYGNYASASYLRNLTPKEMSPYLPFESYLIIKREYEAGRVVPVFPDNAVMSFLRRLEPCNLESIFDVREGLHNRIVNAIRQSTSFDDVLKKATSKRYTTSRIRRILMSAYVGIDKALVEENPIPPYIRILAINNRGRSVLRNSVSSYPILSLGKQGASLSPIGRRHFMKECLADDLYAMAFVSQTEHKAGTDIRLSPYYEK